MNTNTLFSIVGLENGKRIAKFSGIKAEDLEKAYHHMNCTIGGYVGICDIVVMIEEYDADVLYEYYEDKNFSDFDHIVEFDSSIKGEVYYDSKKKEITG